MTTDLPATRRAALLDVAEIIATDWARESDRTIAQYIRRRAGAYPEHDTTEPTPEPDPWPEPTAMPLVFVAGQLTPGGPSVCRINGHDVPAPVLMAVRKSYRWWDTKERRLREELRQQALRQALAEREVTDLRAEVELLRGQLAAILPYALAGADALDMYEPYGRDHGITDATHTELCEGARAMTARIVSGEFGPIAPEAPTGEPAPAPAGPASGPAPPSLLGALDRALTSATAARREVRAVGDALGVAWRSPDCRAAKHTACTGDAWDATADQMTPCGCTCHRGPTP